LPDLLFGSLPLLYQLVFLLPYIRTQCKQIIEA